MKRTIWQEIVLFYQFMTGQHYIVRERTVLV